MKKSRLKYEIRYIKNCLSDCQSLVERTKIEAMAEMKVAQFRMAEAQDLRKQMLAVSQKRPNWANEIQSAEFKKWRNAQDDTDHIASTVDADEVLTIFARFDKRKKIKK